MHMMIVSQRCDVFQPLRDLRPIGETSAPPTTPPLPSALPEETAMPTCTHKSAQLLALGWEGLHSVTHPLASSPPRASLHSQCREQRRRGL